MNKLLIDDKKKRSFKTVTAFIVGKIVSPLGILASVGLAIGALVIVLITTQIQDCADSEDGFATVVYHISTSYSGYAVFITDIEDSFPITSFMTPRNADVQASIKPGIYNIHQYYVSSNEYDLMSDLVRTGLYLPSQDTYDSYDIADNIRLCAGDEYHILGWIQPN